jgi:hypothetical protein
MKGTPQSRKGGSSTHRIVAATFGALFTVIAAAILAVAELTFGSVVAAAVIGTLGIDAIVSAYRDTASLLSRIGPLP